VNGDLGPARPPVKQVFSPNRHLSGPPGDWGYEAAFLRLASDRGDPWLEIVRLGKTGAVGEKQAANVMKIDRPDNLGDIANLGDRTREGALTLAAERLLLAGLQQTILFPPA
jgi:hypothetical protein